MPDNRSSVLLVSLDKQPWSAEAHDKLLSALRSKSNLVEVTFSTHAIDYLSSAADHSAVTITEPSIMKSKNQNLAKILAIYTSGRGTVILGCLFSSFSVPTEVNKYLQSVWTIPYTFGNYSREDFTLNLAAKARFNGTTVPSGYSMKAVTLENVEIEALVYFNYYGTNEAAIALAAVGHGSLGWIGDVNMESESIAVYAAMCSL
ncbi:hypothetical protein MMC24_007426 [Lignoscripta atroalba]|nr:hypothetical protein [Lignoscripta atroalba]